MQINCLFLGERHLHVARLVLVEVGRVAETTQVSLVAAMFALVLFADSRVMVFLAGGATRLAVAGGASVATTKAERALALTASVFSVAYTTTDAAIFCLAVGSSMSVDIAAEAFLCAARVCVVALRSATLTILGWTVVHVVILCAEATNQSCLACVVRVTLYVALAADNFWASVLYVSLIVAVAASHRNRRSRILADTIRVSLLETVAARDLWASITLVARRLAKEAREGLLRLSHAMVTFPSYRFWTSQFFSSFSFLFFFSFNQRSLSFYIGLGLFFYWLFSCGEFSINLAALTLLMREDKEHCSELSNLCSFIGLVIFPFYWLISILCRCFLKHERDASGSMSDQRERETS